MNKTNKTNSFLLCLLFTLSFCELQGTNPTTILSMDQLVWEPVATGVWRAQIGQKQWSALDFASPPKFEALDKLGQAEFPFVPSSCRGQVGPSHSHFRLPIAAEERIYGLGLEFQGANRRGQVYHLKVDHYGGVKGYTHAPVPFYVSSAGYGVLINTARRPTVHAGISNRKDSKLPPRVDRTTGGKKWQARPVSDAVEGSVYGPGMEIYVFGGSSSLEAVQRYNLYCGGGVLPPKWGLGFYHRMHTRSNDKDVMEEIAEFEKYDFPLDVLGLEPGWQSSAYPCTFDWDPVRFPDPKKFTGELLAKGIRLNLWENPYVHPDSTMFDAIRPYTGSHTVWLGEVPDYSLQEARQVLMNHHKETHLNIGVSGYKFDEVDGYDHWLWPDHASFPSGHSGEEIRQLYGLMLQKLFMDQFRDMNMRTYGLIRGSNAGASSHGFVLYSDHYDHKGYVTALTNCSMAGVLWTPEIRSAKSPEEWVRRFQTVAFSPMLQLNAWSSGTKPWSFPEVTDVVRDVVKLRIQLFPYIYSAFAEYQQTGIPPFRSMILESGYSSEEKETEGILHDADNPYAEVQRLETTDQYMMGKSMLVAPFFKGEKSRKVVLPKGDWYDFYTGDLVGNGEVITIQAELDKIPLFVKDGGIIPMMAPVSNLGSLSDNISLEVRHYGGKPGTFSLYDDDGETFDYEKGAFSVITLNAQPRNGKLVGRNSKPKGNWDSRYREFKWKFMTN